MRPVACLAAVLAGSACIHLPPWRAMSPDHLTRVEVRHRGARDCVTVGGQEASCHDGVALDGLVFSDYGARVAYPAKVGLHWTVIRDGQPQGLWDGVGIPVFSRDGARLAFPAYLDSTWRLVVDGTPGKPFRTILAGTVTFDSTGRHHGFVAGDGVSVMAVVDGVPSAPWEGIAGLTFSPTGSHVAWVGRRGRGATLILDGQPVTTAGTITGVIFDANGEHPTWLARRETGWFVQQTGRRFGPYDSVSAVRVLAPRGNVVYVTHGAEGEAVEVDGVMRSRHASIEAPAISRSGERWGYVGHDREGAVVYLGDSVLARERWASNLVVGSGVAFAYLARRGDSAVVVDAHGVRAEELLVEGTLQFLADDSVWTCLAADASRRHFFVIVAGSGQRRALDWTEAMRLMAMQPGAPADADAGLSALRAWVRAEGQLLATVRR